MELEKLANPPIVEVVCGVRFAPIPQIDPISLGRFRDKRRNEFPFHQLHPAIVDEGRNLEIHAGVPPIRTWLISSDDAWILQVQSDRFYLNWRARNKNYPRFSDASGSEGVLSRFLKEFETFRSFCLEDFEVAPEPFALEETKVNHFEEGKAWNGIDDLAQLLPWLGSFAAASESKRPAIAMRFREERRGGAVSIAMEVRDGQAKLETQVVKPLDADLRSCFEAVNQDLNEVFVKLIPQAERMARFGGGNS